MLPWVIFDNQRYIAGYGDFFAFGEIKHLVYSLKYPSKGERNA